jgi:hypothetical protein
VLNAVDASIKRQTYQAIEDTMTVLVQEGIDGLRRRLEKKTP